MIKTITITLLLLTTSYTTFAQCWAKIASGGYHTVAIKTDGTLWVWGLNDKGQLGDGTTVNKNVPTQIGTATDWVKIDASGFSNLAQKANGTLWAWGDNFGGQNGNGNFGPGAINTTPTQIGTDTDWVKFIMGSFAIKSNGTLWGWGSNEEYRLGTGDLIPHYTPFQIGIATDWATIDASGGGALAIKTNHTMWGWGFNKAGSLAIGLPDNGLIPVPTQTGNATADWQEVTMSGCCNSTMIKTDGSLWAMGVNSVGNVGNGGVPNIVNVPTQISTATNWNTITTSNHTCAIKNDGTLWGWGANGVGQLGNGNNTLFYSVPQPITTNFTCKAVKAGFVHTVILDTNNNLYVTGYNNHGQLGDGTFVDKNVFTLINDCSLGTTGFNILQSLQVYPNPTANNSTISYTLSEENKTITIMLVNSLGQLVHQEKVTGKLGENQYPINMNTYSAGLYLVTLKAGDDSVTVKLIKQ